MGDQAKVTASVWLKELDRLSHIFSQFYLALYLEKPPQIKIHHLVEVWLSFYTQNTF